ELEGLDDLVVVDRLAVEIADLLVADAAVVGLVHEMELELVLVHGAEEPHRHRHEPEGDDAGPDRPRGLWHREPSFAVESVVPGPLRRETRRWFTRAAVGNTAFS